MLDLVTAIWLGFIGACLGSFINVVAYRMPRGMSVAWKPSHCPKCGHAIRPRDNVPVLGWLLLRGRCRDCGQPIAPRYAVVEATMGAAFFVLAYVELFTAGANLPGGPFDDASGSWDLVWNPQWGVIQMAGYHALLLCVLMAMLLVDQDRQRIPWKIALFALAAVAAASSNWRYLYFERTRNIRVRDVKASVDALLGAAWGASPWVIALGVLRLRGRAGDNRLRSMALAAATVGAFLGLRPIVRITALWLVAWAILRAVRSRNAAPLTPLLALWLATLVHLLFWKQLAAAFSW